MEQYRKIKILYTIPNFDTAGSGRVVYDLVKGLDKDKFEIEIACSNSKGAFFKEVEGLGVSIHIQNTTTEYQPYLSLFSRIHPIMQFLKNNKYDIVHSWHWSSDWTEVLASRYAGTKWIFTKKAMSWGNRHWKIRSFLASFIVTINDEMCDYFPNKKNQALIPLGIDTSFYDPKLFPREKIDTNSFQIITVANLVPVKGIEVLLKAIHILNDPTITLNVLGDDTNEYSQYLKALVKELNLEQQIVFLGKKPDVRVYIASADLYVIPTLDQGRKEGMPMALVEAMSMGIPVLGSDISGIKFVLKQHKKLLFEAGNEKMLKNSIQSIRNHSFQSRIALGKELRNYVLDNFSYHAFITEHENLYNALINGK